MSLWTIPLSCKYSYAFFIYVIMKNFSFNVSYFYSINNSNVPWSQYSNNKYKWPSHSQWPNILSIFGWFIPSIVSISQSNYWRWKGLPESFVFLSANNFVGYCLRTHLNTFDEVPCPMVVRIVISSNCISIL